jgi:hypothetical protein
MAGLERFNEWEAKNPHYLTPQQALDAVGFLFSLLPPERRLHNDDPTYEGAKRLLEGLSRMRG